MDFKITESTVFVKQLLLQMQEISGHLHSVYRKTINISIGSHLVALQAVGSPVSPISLITELTEEDMENLAVLAGDTVSFSNGYLEIEGTGYRYTFSYSECLFHNTRITTALTPSNSAKLTAGIRETLSLVNTGGFDMIFNGRIDDGSPLMFLAAKTRIGHCSSLYSEGKYTEAGTELARLIGLGIGLTPSGDDFLCGVLAGLLISGKTTHPFAHSLRETIAAHLSDTVDVSASFLSCALEDEFSLAVGSLLSNPIPSQIMHTFLSIGHSSGIDTLCGIWYALQLGTG